MVQWRGATQRGWSERSRTVMYDHRYHHQAADAQGSFRTSRAFLVYAALAIIAGFLLWTEHLAHALGFLPYLLLLACPLMHLFMHGDHAGHGTHTRGDRFDPRPTEIRLTFNEGVIAKFSSAEVKDQAGTEIATGRLATDPKDQKQLIVPLQDPLTPGTYTVNWNVVSVDTHRMNGTYSFKVEH
jgi:methionine-rich copper-binding protein CopC